MKIVVVMILVTIGLWIGWTFWNGSLRRTPGRWTMNPSDSRRLALTREHLDGIDQAMANLMDQLLSIPSSPWMRHSVAMIGSIRARLKQVQYDLEQLFVGRWRLDESIHSTLNALQQETGIATQLLLDIRPEAWNEDARTFNVARIIQDAIYVAFLHNSLSELRVRLELDVAGKVFIEVRDNREIFNVGESAQQSGVLFSPLLEKVQAIEGKIEVSSVSGQGTIIQVTGQL